MTKQSFIIQTSWLMKPAKIRVSVHDTVQELQAATDTPHAGGVCETWKIIKIDKDGKEELQRDGRIHCHIHLHRNSLTAGVVSHESTHAALHLYRIASPLKSQQEVAVIPADCGGNGFLEESFAYTVGDITSKIYKALYRRGIL